MKTKLFALIIFVFCSAGFFSCSDDGEDVKKTEVVLSITNPANLDDLTVQWAITFTERNTGRKYAFETRTDTLSAILPEGDYEIVGESPVTYTFQGNHVESKLYFINKSSIVIGETVNLTASSFPKSEYEGKDGGFVIEEVCYTGTVTPEGKPYRGDNYIKLYNNSDKTLYADGLFLASTQRNTAIAYTYMPEILDKEVPVTGIIVIPGDGTKYPVEPGKSFILTQSAVNHKEGNINSYDLTIANMEWRNEHLSNQPANNPNVPDAILLYNFFSLHSSGLTSIIMGRLEVSQQKFLEDYVYEYKWKTVINGTEYERGPFLNYKIPNEWVMDAVYTSVEGQALVPVFAPSIDMGWTYCGSSNGDPERYGKSVRRKVESTTPDGRNILQDTNNSSVDFIPNATPSLAK